MRSKIVTIGARSHADFLGVFETAFCTLSMVLESPVFFFTYYQYPERGRLTEQSIFDPEQVQLQIVF